MKLFPSGDLFRSIHRRFHRLFWPILTAFALLAIVQLKDGTYLQNAAAPNGIISLELMHDQADGRSIVASWKKDSLDLSAVDDCIQSPPAVNRLHKARTDVRIDFIFILLYTSLAIVIIATLKTRQGKEERFFSKLLIWIAVLAGICDVIENCGMLRFINDGIAGTAKASAFTAAITHTLAMTKFALLALLLLWLPLNLIFRDQALQWLSAYLRSKALQLFRYRVILVSVLAFTVPIWIMDQGQDLLVNSNSSDEGVGLFLTVVVCAAFLNWYLAKLFFAKQYCGPILPLTEPVLSDMAQQIAERKVSRYLGICTILVPAVAILNALGVLRIHYPLDIFPPIVWLIGLLGLFYALVSQDLAAQAWTWMDMRWGTKRARLVTISVIFLLAFALPVFIRLTFLKELRQAPVSLIWLFAHLLLMTFAFWIFVSTRTCLFPGNGLLGKKIGYPVILISLLLAAGFIFFNISPLSISALDCNYLSLPLLLSGIIFYILLFTWLIRLSLCKKINFVFFVVALGLTIAIVSANEYHSVAYRIDPAEITPFDRSRPTLNEYFRAWLLSRKSEIDSSKGNYPIFLVNTYGGGIKAAAFTNMVLSYLDSTMIADKKIGKGFEHFVFSISGASGGTIGAAVQCAYRAKHLDRSDTAYCLSRFTNFYRHDFLTPVLTNMIGRDVWGSMAVYPLWEDRSAVQEELWSDFGRRTLDIGLDQSFDHLWPAGNTIAPNTEVPLLFSNTLNVDDGLKGIMAPVILSKEDFPGTIFIRDRIRAENESRNKKADPVHISLMTGAFLSARFPFISPSGKMGAGYHFMDGGAKDNSGASTSESIFISLARQACRQSSPATDSTFQRLIKKVHFYFLSLTNSPYYDPDTRKLVANRFEPISPLIGIVNSGIYGNAQAADNNIQFRYSDDSTQFRGIRADYSSIWITGSCIMDERSEPYKPVLPLGWQISSPSLERLRRSFDPDMIRTYNPTGIRKVLQVVNNR